MNILWLSTRSPYPLISGHSMRTYHTLRNAAERHNVFLLTFVQLPEELHELNLAHLREFCRCVFPLRIPVDSSIFRLGVSLSANLGSRLPFVAVKYDVRTMRERIRTILKRESIDMVHVDMLPLSVYVDEFMNKPKVIVNHNVESIRLYRWYEAERNLIKRQYLRMQWLRLRSFERTALERFESCIAVSETDRHALEGMGIRTRMFVVPNGTDTRYFVPSTKEPVADRVLWFGHMDVHTNRDAVLYFWREICPILRTRHPQTELMFVGTKPPKEIADAGKWDPRIRTTGFVDDIRPHVQGSAVVVVPIRIGSGTRLKILDAMAMGKAIVSTSVGSEGLDVTDTKDICIADDPHSFAEKTIMLIKNAAFRRTLERNARQLALSYDWSRMGAEQERAYDHAVTRWSCIGRLMGREKGIGCGREGEREVQRCEREFC